jgi:hypothetical protein
MSNSKLGLFDKNGVELLDSSVIYGSLVGQSSTHYFNIGNSANDVGTIDMIASTYVHNVKQSDLFNFEFKGLVKNNLDLLACPC